jgi:hypothetical protein
MDTERGNSEWEGDGNTWTKSAMVTTQQDTVLKYTEKDVQKLNKYVKRSEVL